MVFTSGLYLLQSLSREGFSGRGPTGCFEASGLHGLKEQRGSSRLYQALFVLFFLPKSYTGYSRFWSIRKRTFKK